MVHGTPDWGGSNPKSTTYKLDDHAELAARLGSIVSFERRGDVLWMNDFSEGGQPYFVFGIGIGREVYLSCAGALSGGLCLNIKTGDLGGDYEGISQYSFFPVEGGIGHEIWFTGKANLSDVIVGNLIYTGTNLEDYRVRYNYVTGKLYVWDTGGVYQEIGTPGVYVNGYGAFNPIKMVFNILTHKYTRILFGSRVYDASKYGPEITLSGFNRCMLSQVTVVAAAAMSVMVSVDNWIMTQNEPIT